MNPTLDLALLAVAEVILKEIPPPDELAQGTDAYMGFWLPHQQPLTTAKVWMFGALDIRVKLLAHGLVTFLKTATIAPELAYLALRQLVISIPPCEDYVILQPAEVWSQVEITFNRLAQPSEFHAIALCAQKKELRAAYGGQSDEVLELITLGIAILKHECPDVVEPFLIAAADTWTTWASKRRAAVGTIPSHG